MSTSAPLLLGLSSYIFRWAIGTPSFQPLQPLDAFGVLERAQSLGVQSVQFCDNLPLHRLHRSEWQRLLGVAAEMGLGIGLGTTGLDRDRLQRYLELGAEAGTRYVRLVPGTRDGSALEAAIRQILPDCHSLSVGIALETHADIPTHQLAMVVQAIADPMVRVCLDTANSLGQLELPSAFIPRLAPLTVQIHLKDYTVEPMEIGHHITGRPLGEGKLDLTMVREALLASGSRPEVLLELWTDPASTIEATLAKEVDWIQLSVAKAKEWLQGFA